MPKQPPNTARLQHPDGRVEYVPLGEPDDCVDTASQDSFPASDPPSSTPVTHTGKPKTEPVKQKH